MGTGERRRRNSITREEIVDAAFALYEEGAGEVSLRMVATQIGAAPMSLYAHIATKEDLLDAVTDRVLAEVDSFDEGGTGDWLDDLTDRALWHLSVLRAHPWAMQILLARPNPGQAAARTGETYFRLLGRELDAPTAAIAFTALLALIYGSAAFLTAASRVTPSQSRSEVVGRMRTTEDLEYTAGAADELADYGSNAHVRLAVRALLTGFRHPTATRPS